MKIFALIPVERIDMPMRAGFTFRREAHEVEVIRVIRYPASKNKALNRWHYQSRIQVGYLDHKVTLVTRSDGSEKTVEQVLVTPKGLAKLAAALNMQAAA